MTMAIGPAEIVFIAMGMGMLALIRFSDRIEEALR